jgi:hypothetical protein
MNALANWPGRIWRGGLLLVALWLAALPLRAQTLDSIEVVKQGEQQLLRMRFNATVSFLQLVPAGTADLYTLRFELLAGDEAVLRQTTDEFRRLPAADGRPELTLTYAADPRSRVKQLTLRLARPLPLEARQGVNARSLEVLLRIPVEQTATPLPEAAQAAVAAQPEVERQAALQMALAQQALAERRADDAVAALNEVLKLPPNSQSMLAQELIGNAWDQAGSGLRARVEYSLYLRLYPQGDGAARVALRLAALGGPVVRDAAGAASAPATAVRADAPRTWTGTLAQYYYGGKARSQSLVNIATGIDQVTLSRTTESAIVTSADFSARADAFGGENRAVIRGSASTNLQSNSSSGSDASIGSAYVEHRRGSEGLAVRLGRQSPISGGLLGLFDGVSVAWPVGTGLKLDLMAGVPANALVSAPSERLMAAVLEADGIFDRWGGNLYLLDQTTEGITNRRSLGTEVRYAGDSWSVNTLVDYDTVFGLVNAVSAHGSTQVGAQTTLTLLLDQRRAPSLQLTNALISSGAASLKTLLQTRTLAQIKALALDTSATARQFLVSLSRPLDARWQLSTDLRYSQVGALPAVGDFEATAATGAQYGLSAQLTGTNLYSKRDINNFNLSLITTPFFNGFQIAYNNLTGIGDSHDLTLEPSLRLYAQRDKDGVRLVRIGPGLRMSYRTGARSSVLGELLYENSRTDGPSNHDDSNSVFFYVGYRYELF